MSRVNPLSSLQLANVAAVIGLLTTIPDDQYKHRVFGHGADLDAEVPTAACAVGHAFRNPNQFRVEVEERNLFQRLFGIKTAKPDTKDSHPRTFALDVFGGPLYRHAFDSDAYGMDPDSVTKNMVLDRLFKVKAAGGIPVAA